LHPGSIVKRDRNRSQCHDDVGSFALVIAPRRVRAAPDENGDLGFVKEEIHHAEREEHAACLEAPHARACSSARVPAQVLDDARQDLPGAARQIEDRLARMRVEDPDHEVGKRWRTRQAGHHGGEVGEVSQSRADGEVEGVDRIQDFPKTCRQWELITEVCEDVPYTNRDWVVAFKRTQAWQERAADEARQFVPAQAAA
jgi:hypothetical protein